jgi:hypothetical protein
MRSEKEARRVSEGARSVEGRFANRATARTLAPRGNVLLIRGMRRSFRATARLVDPNRALRFLANASGFLASHLVPVEYSPHSPVQSRRVR